MNSKKTGENLGKVVSGVIAFTLCAKLLGFLREIVLSYFFGATGISDAFLISQNIPGTIFTFVGTGLTTCFVPIYFKILAEQNEKYASEFTNRIITIVWSFSALLVALVWIFTPVVVKLFALGFEGDTLYYAVWFTRIGIVSLFFSTIIYVYNNYLQVNKQFNIVAFSAIPNSLCVIAAIVLGAKVNIWLLPIGSVVAIFVQSLFLIVPVHKLGHSLRLNFKWKDSYLKKFFILLGPVVLGVSVNSINSLVDRTIASQIAVGSISALTYADSLVQMVQGGLVQPVSTVFYPKITEAVTNNQSSDARTAVEKAISALLTLLMPITVGFMLFSKEITGLIFGRGAFDETAVSLTATSLFFYSIGICFVGIRELLSRYFYAFSNTKTPTINAAIGVVINILMNLLLSKYIGIAGLAIATSISAIITAVLLWISTRSLGENNMIVLDIKQILRIIGATLVMGGTAKLLQTKIADLGHVSIIITVVIAAVVYFAVAICLKIEFVTEIFDKVKVRLKR